MLNVLPERFTEFENCAILGKQDAEMDWKLEGERELSS